MSNIIRPKAFAGVKAPANRRVDIYLAVHDPKTVELGCTKIRGVDLGFDQLPGGCILAVPYLRKGVMPRLDSLVPSELAEQQEAVGATLQRRADEMTALRARGMVNPKFLPAARKSQAKAPAASRQSMTSPTRPAA